MSSDQSHLAIRDLMNQPAGAGKWMKAVRDGLVSESQALEHRTREIVQERIESIKGNNLDHCWRVTIKGSEFEDRGLFASTCQDDALKTAGYLIEEVGFSADAVLIEQVQMTPHEYSEAATAWMRLRGRFKTSLTSACDDWRVGPRGGVYRISNTGRSRIYM